ncbi:YoaK family protein [Marinomonas sp. GJ51-6]|uniref:YoaK family protein n=1 Tax=Marinomonas sp. GJ51-6 TaxID=2992802 RepID=UPI0029347F2F|nr:YoaK family protein [Marinomonas sp. GJ51-6]WOD07417.1 YoaK family protein [Marinomonas sp. GJ51-6]
MISTLPKWVEYGAFSLALGAGSINAIALLGMEHQAVSHLSGTATLLGNAFLGLSYTALFHLIGILLSFVAGSVFSGFILTGTSLKLGRFYDLLLIVEAILLLMAMFSLLNNHATGHYFASAACGLQNALATTYSGAVLRTTHLTGIFTDLGIMIGGVLRGESFDKRKASLFVIIVVGFILGGTLGAYLFKQLSFYALLAPVTLCVFLAILYRIYRMRLSRDN